MSLRLLIIGGGGREHALARQLAASPQRPELWAAPGNPGIAEAARIVDISAADTAGLTALCRRERIDAALIGPEDPLIAGLADRLREAGVAVFGPGAAGARLEGDKEFAKQVLASAGVPTAGYAAFDDLAAARAHLARVEFPVVIKAVGAAQGKGVAVCQDRQAAEDHLAACLVQERFGAAGRRVLVEQCLSGPELSVFAVTDGEDHVLLAPARDHKRAGEGDSGPNTGGMGAYAPAAPGDPALYGIIDRTIITPTLVELRRRGIAYRGLLYAGLMLTASGPQVLEFNCRFGDPETQAVLPLLRIDLCDLVMAAAEGRLGAWRRRLPPPGPGAPAGWPGAAATDWEKVCVVVVAAAVGYPGTYRRHLPLRLPGPPASADPDVWLLHAGTTLLDGQLVTAGGRVLGAVGRGADLGAARGRAYALLAGVEGAGLFFRRDIGAPARRAGAVARGGKDEAS